MIFFRRMTRAVGVSVLLMGFAVVLPSSALASTFLVPKNVIAIPVGGTFPIPIVVDPSGEKQYTVRLSLTFPDAFEVTSFTFAPGWVSILQPDSDLIDNKHGVLIKTAGLPNGFSTAKPFGVITFRAKHGGEAIISIGSRSLILNAESKNTFQQTSQIHAIITTATTPNAIVNATGSAAVANPSSGMPSAQENLFDITAEPQQTEAPNPLYLFGGVLLVGILLALTGRFIYGRGKQWRLVQKLRKP